MINNELYKRILSSLFLIPIVVLIIIQGSIIFNLFLIISVCIAIFEWQMMSINKPYKFVGIVYIIFSFYTFYALRNLNNEYIYFMFVLVICISTDIGGYTFGKIFKGPKLISISPKKTYSGAIGGVIFALACTLFFFKVSFFFPEKPEISINTYLIIVFISIISQLGDIIVSYFKRLSKIKDTGSIIPGHGGLLDRADGMIFAFPISYILLSTNLFKVL